MEEYSHGSSIPLTPPPFFLFFIFILGYLIRIVRQYEIRHEAQADLALLCYSLNELDMKCHTDVEFHLLVEGILRNLEIFLHTWEKKIMHKVGKEDEELIKSWERDKAILNIAKTARNRRFEVAMSKL